MLKKKVPFMVMTYLGTVKTGLYWLLLHFWTPSVYLLRVPVLLLGLLTILIFYFFALRATAPSTALFATALLATDTSYLLTTAMDWGPVAIQHLCHVAGLFLILKSYQTKRLAPLAGGCFALGIGLWDKALFLWMLSGAGFACLIVFFTEIKRFLTPRRIITAGFFFLLGALPFVIYNIRRPLETFRGNASFSRDDLSNKIHLLPYTMNGSVLFGYLVDEDWAVKTPGQPRTAVERASLALAQLSGERRENLYWYAFAASLLLTPLLLATSWRRPVLFLLLMMAAAWAQMLATKGAGGGAHHSILLWPYPLLLVGIAASWVASKLGRYGTPFQLALAVVLCGSALVVNNNYLRQAIRDGGAASWSNANFTLASELGRFHASKIYLIDWGMFDNTRFLTSGRLPLLLGSDPLMRPEPTPDEMRFVKFMVEDPKAIFAGNTDTKQVFPEVNQRIKALAARLGYEREHLETVYDYHGRPFYEIFRFHPKAADRTAISPPNRSLKR
ncbi:MAG: hypothetical protein IT167_13810 [Bryobacterales bacterium]|nr:hypothetical protein [Bryobacterales bacterium]